jgi:hypothetical protein
MTFRFDFKVGDIIEWRYNPEYENRCVLAKEHVWYKGKKIFIDNHALCLAIENDTYTFFSNNQIKTLNVFHTTPCLFSRSCVWAKPVKIT